MNEAEIGEHRKFWNGEENSKPLVSFRLGNYFFATHFSAAKKLIVKGTKIRPEMIDVDSFLEDYEGMYNEVSSLGQSGIWTAEPYTGIPWMEAFWGCEISGSGESFTAGPYVKEAADLDQLHFTMENPWVAKYFEFVKKLNVLSRGRFPVGAPILRGQGDTLGALMGQTEFIYALYEEPARIRKALGKIIESFLEIYKEMHRLNGLFYGGSSMGFYHIWTPGKSLWFQDDIGALLSPGLYREFLLENEKYITSKYEYTLTHLHPSSFHLLDEMLGNEHLKAVEINKDVGGPSVEEMLPWYKKVLDKKRRLVVWGDLSREELKLVFDNLKSSSGSPPLGIYFVMVLPDRESAKKILSYLNSESH